MRQLQCRYKQVLSTFNLFALENLMFFFAPLLLILPISLYDHIFWDFLTWNYVSEFFYTSALQVAFLSSVMFSSPPPYSSSPMDENLPYRLYVCTYSVPLLVEFYLFDEISEDCFNEQNSQSFLCSGHAMEKKKLHSVA